MINITLCLFCSIEVRSRLNSNVTQLSLPVCSSANPYSTEAAGHDWDNALANAATLPCCDEGNILNENSSNSIHGIDNRHFNDCDNATVNSDSTEHVADDVQSEFDLDSPEIADINISLTVLHDTIDAVVQRLGDDDDDLQSTVDSLHNGGNWSTKSFRSAVSIDDTIDAIFADALSDEETCCSVSSSSSSSISK